jgi:biopolymer transport protein ExbD
VAGKNLFANDGEDAFKRERGAPPGELDITPMIDVTFLLLIFFMVSSTMQPAASLDLPPADFSKGVTVSSSAVVVAKAPSGANIDPQLFLGEDAQSESSMGELRSYLEDQQRAGVNKVVIKAEGDVPHGFVDEIARAIKELEGLEMYLGVGDSKQEKPE